MNHFTLQSKNPGQFMRRIYGAWIVANVLALYGLISFLGENPTVGQEELSIHLMAGLYILDAVIALLVFAFLEGKVIATPRTTLYPKIKLRSPSLLARLRVRAASAITVHFREV